MNADAVVKLQDVVVQHGDQVVLQDIQMELDRGDFVYLIGKTGSGKSSLLKTLYGALPLQSGKGYVAGFDLRNLKRQQRPLLRRKLGMVFQSFNLLMDRNVEDNLLFVLGATGWRDKANMRRRMEQVLTEVGMEEARDKMPHTLSGGEQQRIVIARALLNAPTLLIADEATGNLDPNTSSEIIELLQKIGEQRAMAILFATHDYRMLDRYPGKVLRCYEGRVVEDQKLII